MKKSLAHFFQLCFILAKVNFKIKTEGSYLGLLWHVLNPLFTFLLLLFIFQNITGASIKHYPLYLLLGIIVFNFFQKSTVEAVNVMSQNYSMIRTSVFNINALPVSVITENLFVHLIELVILAVFMLIYGVSVASLALYLPILIIYLMFLTGTCMFLAAITVYILDFKHLWTYGTRILWFITPIFYSATSHEGLQLINTFNPLYYFITISREVIIYQIYPGPQIIIIALLFSLVSVVVGWLVFNSLKKSFAELI